MNTVELLQYSLDFAFDVLGQVTADLTQEQAEWKPPGITSTIGSIYAHILTYVDFFLHEVCIPRSDSIFRDPPPDKIIMGDIQVDLSELHQRAGEVQRVAHDWISSLTSDVLEQKMETSIGELNFGPMLEAFVISHINMHCGEISALKGCQGAKGYPW